MKQCELCGKGSQMQGKRILLRGHYNPTNWSRKQPNLQWARISGERKRVCTQCMKKLVKTPSPTAIKTA
jgi:ribosomal protein L28